MLMSRCSFGLLRSWFHRSRFIEEQQPGQIRTFTLL